MPAPRGPPIGGLRPRPGGGSNVTSLSPGTVRRIGWGFLWGVVAALVMGAVLMAGQRSVWWPLPEPVGAALVDALVDAELTTTAVALIAGGLHLLYGGFWGSVLAVSRVPVRWHNGLLLGGVLWGLQQLLILPMAGWGIAGREVDLGIAAATALTHLVYGATLGVLLHRMDDPVAGRQALAQALKEQGAG